MSVIRAFIAIELPKDIRNKLSGVETSLKTSLRQVAIRWVPVDNIHITLKFLGDVSENNLEYLKQLIDVEAQKYAPFEIDIGQLGGYPNLNRPRVLWIGVAAPPALGTLQHNIEAETRRLGYAMEDRPFSPHLTLGRISHHASIQDVKKVSEILNQSKVESLGTAIVDKIVLFRSDLNPGGAVYTPLHIAPFRAS